ncbi:ArdC-like ssDNA-binding domain-containing protein [Bernardetia sp. Wsw4-3y2]|uniref:ArdC-like ssDNA-binding domain-containing protein n=1 Tax=Bernardetia sp. Wsw4-3y2 TaxID=3127471 RepID=UPI0030D2780C
MTNIQEITEFANLHAAEYGTSRKEKYIFLSNLSRNLNKAIEDDALTAEFFEDCENTNAILRKHYQNQYRVERFNTFLGWKEEGFKVKKGSKAFLFWSKPKVPKANEEGKKIVEDFNIDEDADEHKKYFISHLFSNLQVEEIQKSKEAKKVLELMDKDVDYQKAVKIVLVNSKVSKKKLEKELNNYI